MSEMATMEPEKPSKAHWWQIEGVLLVDNPVTQLFNSGSVDDVKATLISRLLFEGDSVPDETIDAARSLSRSGSLVKR
jgi:hypothetical protein